MTWPFLSSMRNAAAVSSSTSQATAHLTPAQQLLLAPRAVHRRRYLKETKNQTFFVVLCASQLGDRLASCHLTTTTRFFCVCEFQNTIQLIIPPTATATIIKIINNFIANPEQQSKTLVDGLLNEFCAFVSAFI